MWRRTAIVDAGGWHYDTLSEDADLSYRAQDRGWKLLYVPEIECPSELPVDMNGFKTQQFRWAKGTIQTAKKLLPGLMRSDQPLRVKFEAFFHLTGYLNFPFMVSLAILMLPAMNLRLFQYHGGLQALIVNYWLFVSTTCSLVFFFACSQHALYPRTWKNSMLFLPHLMAVGIGISIWNAKAVFEALFGVKSDFARTPKFGVVGKSGISSKKSYRGCGGWMPFLDIFLGLYFITIIIRAILVGNYTAVPFLALFVWGFLYTGVLAVGQGWWDRQQSNA
jgi:cellulose synthase/poly-beta-1,6-N-acetylglucosamine synthase-like glycosyltransferase